MSTPVVTDEMVEAGAAVLFAEAHDGMDLTAFSGDIQANWHGTARRMLEAALAVAPATESLDTVLAEIEATTSRIADFSYGSDGQWELTTHHKTLQDWFSARGPTPLAAAIALRDAIKGQVTP